MTREYATARRPVPLLALGFRVFYLVAGAYAALGIIGWALQFAGLRHEGPLLGGPLWHAREMFFGYAFAVIAGFLFTAVRNWTAQPTPTGLPLAALAGVWAIGRILAYTPWRELSAVSDLVFAIGVAIGIARPLFASGNRRNYFFIALVLVLGLLNLAYVSALAGWMPIAMARAPAIIADLILFIMTVVAGRVVPMFTNNGVPGAGASRNQTLEKVALGSVLALVAADVANVPALVAIVAAIAAVAHAWRLALWSPWKTLRVPLLWILHASYAWIVAHLALRACGALGWVTPGIAMHALTVGAIGGLTLGMMTRSALGHTGRPLRAGGVEITAYVLVELAAIARVIVPLVAPAAYLYAIIAAGVLWSAAFAVFTFGYWPILSRPRIDGRPG